MSKELYRIAKADELPVHNRKGVGNQRKEGREGRGFEGVKWDLELDTSSTIVWY